MLVGQAPRITREYFTNAMTSRKVGFPMPTGDFNINKPQFLRSSEMRIFSLTSINTLDLQLRDHPVGTEVFSACLQL